MTSSLVRRYPAPCGEMEMKAARFTKMKELLGDTATPETG